MMLAYENRPPDVTLTKFKHRERDSAEDNMIPSQVFSHILFVKKLCIVI